jgi:hypothetical protein
LQWWRVAKLKKVGYSIAFQPYLMFLEEKFGGLVGLKHKT